MSTNQSLVKRDETNPEHIGTNPVITPLVDIYENDDEVLLVADLPGVRRDDLDIQLNKDVLVLNGRRILADGDARGARGVDYHREFLVGSAVDGDKISAQLSDGVLRLHLPKAAALKPRKIAVAAG